MKTLPLVKYCMKNIYTFVGSKEKQVQCMQQQTADEWKCYGFYLTVLFNKKSHTLFMDLPHSVQHWKLYQFF